MTKWILSKFEDNDDNKENEHPNIAQKRYTKRLMKSEMMAESRKKRRVSIDSFIHDNTVMLDRIRTTSICTPAGELPLPKRENAILTEDAIAIAIRVVLILEKEKAEHHVVSTTGVIEQASEYLGIGQTKLRELFKTYSAMQGKVLPLSAKQQGPRELRGRLRNEWFGPLRDEISRIRLVVGKPVELPDLLKWFRETHQMVVKRKELYYALKRMGFVFGRTKKLTLLRESERITHLRRQYLQRRVLQDEEIRQRKMSMVDHSEGVEGPNQRILCYLYLDESYCNRNHTRGFTWYHPTDAYGSACNLPSGKGERLVMLTGISAGINVDIWSI